MQETSRNQLQPLMQLYATGCVWLRLQLHSFVENLRPVSVRLHQKRQKNRTGPDFKTLLTDITDTNDYSLTANTVVKLSLPGYSEHGCLCW